MTQKNIKVLIVGSDSSVKGGITSVINSFLDYKWKNICVELHPTYIDGKVINKIMFFLRSICKYIKKLINNDFDISHIHMSYKGSFIRKFIVVKLSKFFDKMVILHLHGSEFEVFYNSSNKVVKLLIKNIFESSDKVIVLGEKWKKTIQKIAPKSSIEVFNNAVSLPAYKAKLSENKINILFLGVLIKRKGIYELIEAIKILHQRGIVKEKNLKFIIAGSGKEEYAVKSLISKYELDYCIDMVGWVDKNKKIHLLKISNLFVLPSYNEGLPVAILEAMSYGIPVISTNVGSIEEVVKNNETGFIINPGNIYEIVDSINKLVINEKIWEEKSIKSRQLIDRDFNDEQYFHKMKKLYWEIFQ